MDDLLLTPIIIQILKSSLILVYIESWNLGHVGSPLQGTSSPFPSLLVVQVTPPWPVAFQNSFHSTQRLYIRLVKDANSERVARIILIFG